MSLKDGDFADFEILSLSSCTRYIETKNSGHNVQLIEPDTSIDDISGSVSMISGRLLHEESSTLAQAIR